MVCSGSGGHAKVTTPRYSQKHEARWTASTGGVCTFRESARKSPFNSNLKGLLAIRKFLQDARSRHYNRTSPDAPSWSWVHARAMPKKRKIRKSVKSKPFRRCLSIPFPVFLSLWSNPLLLSSIPFRSQILPVFALET